MVMAPPGLATYYSDDGHHMWDEGEQTPGKLTDLLNRARGALAEHVSPSVAEHLNPSVADALAMLEGTPGLGGLGEHIAVRLHVEPHTQAVMLRFYDRRTGATIQELHPLSVAHALADVPPTIAGKD